MKESHDGHTLDALAHRLRKLETHARWHKAIIVIAAVTALAGWQSKKAGPLVGSSLTLVRSDGKKFLTANTNRDRTALEIWTEDSNNSAIVMAYDKLQEEAFVDCFGKRGHRRASLTANDDEASLYLSASDGGSVRIAGDEDKATVHADFREHGATIDVTKNGVVKRGL